MEYRGCRRRERRSRPGARAAAFSAVAPRARRARRDSGIRSSWSLDLPRDGKAAEAAPAGQHGGEVAAAARDDDVDVLGGRGHGYPGGGIVDVVPDGITAGVDLHLAE